MDDEQLEEVLNEIADNLEGVIAILDDVLAPDTADDRIKACVAALRRSREIMGPILSSL